MLASVEDVLLHLCTPADWRAALTSGSVAPPSLEEVGFVHLSTAEQVALPAERLFHGRRDMVLLVVDRATLDRAGIDLRWEPGVPGDPESMRFPHAYGAVPASAVLAVLPYRPDGEGRFAAPSVPEPDARNRAALSEPSLLRRAATEEIPVTGGVAVRTDAVPASRMHNQLLLEGAVDAATVVAEADRTLDGLAHRAAVLYGEALAGAADDLRGRGWTVDELRLMTAPAARAPGESAPGGSGPGGTGPSRVEDVDIEALRPQWDATWRRTVPGMPDGEIAQLTDRYRIEEAVTRVLPLAVRDGATVVASCLLKIDGATAWLDLLETDPRHRGRGHGRALVEAARDRAAAAGCDLVALSTAAQGWPREWYARCGFVEVGRCWVAARF
ncbi:MAG: GNAT family N-acetyltransferase [Pseudonocardia sp.]|nr:GNAT family N-acetyltransferase [Pseudonocardia sp.]